MAFLQPDAVKQCNGVTVKEYFLTEHNPNKITLPSKKTSPNIGVTIHNTEAIKQATGTTMAEQYVRATQNGNMGGVVVHYYVDDVEAWHCLPDNYRGFHAADYTGDGNYKTIAIEVIGKTKKAEDNAARLAAYILFEQNLDENCIYTHSHWMNKRDGKTGTRQELNVMYNTRKNCPAYILPHWTDFENKIVEYLNTLKPKQSTQTIYRVQVGAYSNRDNAERFLELVKSKGFDNAFITKVELPITP